MKEVIKQTKVKRPHGLNHTIHTEGRDTIELMAAANTQCEKEIPLVSL